MPRQHDYETPRTFGVIGDPVEHSLSPVIHNAAFAAQHIHAVYLKLHARQQDLRNVPLAMRLADIEGINVTTPHKQTIIPYLDKLDRSAVAAGAVNTIYRRGRRLIGANTDGAGFLAACRRCGITLKGKTVVILGAGGAAAGIAVSVLREKVRRLILLNRTVSRARLLRKRFVRLSRADIQCAGLTPASFREFFPQTDILIHATSQGMGDASRLRIPLHLLPGHAVICDCQYHPSRTTPLIRQALGRHHRIVNGLDLLLGQAAESYRLWTGRTAPLAAMRRTIFNIQRARRA